MQIVALTHCLGNKDEKKQYIVSIDVVFLEYSQSTIGRIHGCRTHRYGANCMYFVIEKGERDIGESSVCFKCSRKKTGSAS